MSGPLRDIDNLFFNGIEEHAEYPSDKVWDNIEADLDKKTADIYKRKYKTLKRSAAVLLLLLMAVVIYEARLILKGKENIGGVRQIISFSNEKKPEAPIKASADKDKVVSAERKITREEQANIHSPEPVLNRNIENISVITKNKPDNADFTAIAEQPASANKNMAGNSSELNTSLQKNLLSFKAASFDNDWKNDIVNAASGIVIKPTNPSFVQPFSLLHDNQGIGISRLSLSLSFASNMAWKTIEDDKPPHRRGNRGGGRGGNGPGNGSGGNGGGNGGGGNGGGGNGGGNNGGGGRPGGQSRHDFETTEDNNIAYSGTLQLGYQVTRKLSLKTGLSFLVSSTTVSSKKAYAAKDDNGKVSYRFNCSSGYSYLLPEGASAPNAGDSTVISNSRNASSYLGIPVSAEYKIFSAGRFSLSAAAGGQLNILVHANTTAEFDATSTGKSTASNHTKGLKKAYISALGSITAEMKVSRKLSVTLAPETQFGLTYINTQSWVKTRSNFMGLAAGLKLKL